MSTFTFEEEKKLLIRDFLVGMVSQFNPQDVSLYPLLDALHLFDQKPRVYSFYRWSELCEPAYTTMQDYELRRRFRHSTKQEIKRDDLIDCGDYGMSIHTIPDFEEIKGLVFQLNHCGSKLHRAYGSLFESLRSHKQGKEFIKTLCDTIHKRENKSPSRPKGEFFPVDEDEVKRYLEPMREVIDGALFDLDETSLLRRIPGSEKDISFPNLFAVVRSATVSKIRYGFFNYTARLTLSKSQREYFERNLKGSNLVQHLENPLGENARSIADSVYCSGVIDFSGEKAGTGRDKSGNGRKDIDRLEAEKEVYRSIISEHRVFYTPIHVDGIPWVAFFVLTPKEATDESWLHNYRVYRIQIPKIAERVRLGAKLEYKRWLGKIITENFLRYRNLNAKFYEDVNTSLKRLSAIYPFGVLALSSRKYPSSMELILPNDENTFLEFSENPFFERQIDYYILQMDEVAQFLKQTMQDSRMIVLEQYKEKIEDQQHIIFNHYAFNELPKIIRCHEQSMPDGLRRDLKEYLKTAEIADIAIRYAFNNTSNLATRMNVSSIVGLLRWLEDHVPSSTEIRPHLKIDTTKDTALDSNALPIAFSIIWNLWHNARKDYTEDKSAEAFDVVLRSEGSVLLLSFENKGTMGPEWVDYLLDKTGYPEGQKGAGLKSLKRNMTKISWSLAEIDTKYHKTRITIRIPLEE